MIETHVSARWDSGLVNQTKLKETMNYAGQTGGSSKKDMVKTLLDYEV